MHSPRKKHLQLFGSPDSKSPDSQSIRAGFSETIKTVEKGRINPAFTILDEHFKPKEGVNYIWVYTENRDIILGIEHLNDQNLEALNNTTVNEKLVVEYLKRMRDKEFTTIKLKLLNVDVKELKDEKQLYATLNKLEGKMDAAAKEKLHKDAEKIQHKKGLGHPTLAIAFDAKGEAVKAKAFLAGEFYFKNGWKINNRSGRFHKIQASQEAIAMLLEEVAKKIEKNIKQKVEVKIHNDKLDPKKIWNKSLLPDKEPNLSPSQRGIYVLMKLFKVLIDGGKQSAQYKAIKKNLLNEQHIAKALGKHPNVLNLKDVINYANSNRCKNKLKATFPETTHKEFIRLYEMFILELKQHMNEPEQAQRNSLNRFI